MSKQIPLAAMQEMTMMPCLRCGESSVPITWLFYLTGQTETTFFCINRRCNAELFLSADIQGNTYQFCYSRYTLRHDLDQYDPGTVPMGIRFDANEPALADDYVAFRGPVIVYPRKSRFSKSEVELIWLASQGRCHLCDRPWRIEDRGRKGWHIDHVIPHIGGGADTERLTNLRVACTTCNLSKGKGYTNVTLRQSLRHLAISLDAVRRLCQAD